MKAATSSPGPAARDWPIAFPTLLLVLPAVRRITAALVQAP
ncbi:DUF2798 domain-containing protein [Nocardia gipuzkoensis]